MVRCTGIHQVNSWHVLHGKCNMYMVDAAWYVQHVVLSVNEISAGALQRCQLNEITLGA